MVLTDPRIAERARCAVAAAASAGRDLGLSVDDPTPLYDVFSVVVHLAPVPVVVRVPTVLPRTVAADPQAQADQQRRELADGLDQLDGCPDLLDPADLRRARHEWSVLHGVLGTAAALAREFPGVRPQPVHGDAPTYNMLATPDGVLCADFEHVTLGVPEWGLVGIEPEDRAAYDAAAGRLGLRPLDDRLLAVMAAARTMQLVACLALAPQLPLLVEGLRPCVDQWREAPFAGGLEARPG